MHPPKASAVSIDIYTRCNNAEFLRDLLSYEIPYLLQLAAFNNYKAVYGEIEVANQDFRFFHSLLPFGLYKPVAGLLLLLQTFWCSINASNVGNFSVQNMHQNGVNCRVIGLA